jgi:hypothetical protein
MNAHSRVTSRSTICTHGQSNMFKRTGKVGSKNDLSRRHCVTNLNATLTTAVIMIRIRIVNQGTSAGNCLFWTTHFIYVETTQAVSEKKYWHINYFRAENTSIL